MVVVVDYHCQLVVYSAPPVKRTGNLPIGSMYSRSRLFQLYSRVYQLGELSPGEVGSA
ncbi:17657_t:CDS:2 [Gigaspora rosea]|nr:17657_t:CDS:2 [Gigaspora rosea]